MWSDGIEQQKNMHIIAVKAVSRFLKVYFPFGLNAYR